MASQSLISAVNSYDNYIQRKGIDEQVIDAYIEACRVAINGEKDITYGLQITNRSKGIIERFCMDRTGGRICLRRTLLFPFALHPSDRYEIRTRVTTVKGWCLTT